MSSQNTRFSFGNHTDIGLVRRQNEDYLGYFDTHAGHIFIVADGMGGHAGGAIAAQMAVEQTRIYLDVSGNYELPMTDLLGKAIEFANHKILDFAAENPQYAGMGTTVVAMLIRKDKACIGHVGDSRAYIFEHKTLSCLTRDHSYVQRLIDENLISEQEAQRHPRRNELLKALGQRRETQAQISEEFECLAGQIYMLATDGVWGLASHEQMSNLLSTLPSQIGLIEAAIELTKIANAAGGPDNGTVQIVFFDDINNSNPDLLSINNSKNDLANRTGTSLINQTYPGISGANATINNTSKSNNNPKRKSIGLYAIIGILMLLFAGFFIYQNSQSKLDIMQEESPIATANQTVDTPASAPIYHQYKPKATERLVDIGRNFGIPYSIIATKNNLPNDSTHKPNSMISIPVRYKVPHSPNQTIIQLAHTYNIDENKLRIANQINSDKFNNILTDTIIIPFDYERNPFNN